ncbi:MAG TPA: hypothetical protein PKX07_10375 [Aggregatilineales bacterium]|nr:hypothetical protein [Aggregatilineales bacterium]
MQKSGANRLLYPLIVAGARPPVKAGLDALRFGNLPDLFAARRDPVYDGLKHDLYQGMHRKTVRQ